MKSKLLNILILLLLLSANSVNPSEKNKTIKNSNVYFPINNGKTLIYESSFGESSTIYFQDGEFTISLSEGDDFKYKQTLMIKEDGVYSKETYQYLKIFLFIKKEATVTYNKPLLRFPLPLVPGAEWKWEGEEYSDGEMNKVKVSGKSFNKELILTKAGRLEAIKIETIIESGDDVKNRVTEWYAEGLGLIKAKIIIEGGGMMGLLRDVLGYGTIEFELAQIRGV
ncbi:MAG TPA: hypothetical protein PKA80_14405 [Ignavibacteriaceae bacterium]|nr:hypothetical protein [Ignavibacteriaceae bacterium]